MRRFFSLPVVLGFVYLNLVLGIVIAVSRFRWPEIVAFLVSLPLVLVAVLVPKFGPRWLAFPSGPGRYWFWLSLVYFVAVILAAMGERRLTFLQQGPAVTGIGVREAPDYPDAVAFEFTDGRGREDLRGMASNIKSQGRDDWYVVPVVPDDWTPDAPVTVWAFNLGGIQPEVVAGEFRAGVRGDDRDERMRYVHRAVRDAEERHGVQSHPGAVILEMDRSVARLREIWIVFLVMAFAGVNLAWGMAVLLSS